MKRRGQVLTEFLVSLPFLVGATGGLLSLLIALSVRAFLDLETYALARAHLYGNGLGFCSPSALWGSFTEGDAFRVRHACATSGWAEGEATWRGRKLFRTRIDLRRGKFER